MERTLVQAHGTDCLKYLIDSEKNRRNMTEISQFRNLVLRKISIVDKFYPWEKVKKKVMLLLISMHETGSEPGIMRGIPRKVKHYEDTCDCIQLILIYTKTTSCNTFCLKFTLKTTFSVNFRCCGVEY